MDLSFSIQEILFSCTVSHRPFGKANTHRSIRGYLRIAPALRVGLNLAVGLLFATGSWAADANEDQVEKILKQMTLDEKLDYIGGINAIAIRPIPRLDLPEIRMSDGPLGVRQDKPSTRYPAGIALAATWNRALAQKQGAAMGRDCR